MSSGLLAVGVTLLLAVSSSLAFTSLSSVETVCGACHAQIAPRLAPHASVPCVECHRARGAAGIIDLRLRMLAMAIPLSAGPKPPVTSDRCLACHGEVLTSVVERGGLRMSHREPHEAGQSCVDCHASLMHDSGGASAGISMDECLRCHTVSALSRDCDTCHVDDVDREERIATGTFARTHGSSWRTSHGSGDIRVCAACHTAARCESCHGTEIPHPFSWLDDHGTQAGQADCTASCHSSSFCRDCHVVEMPHPGGFLARHADVRDDVGQEACLRCHEPRACESCHAKHAHPGLAAERAKKLRGKAGLDD